MFLCLEKHEHFHHLTKNSIGIFVIEHLSAGRFKYVISNQSIPPSESGINQTTCAENVLPLG